LPVSGTPRAVVYGCIGPKLTADERAFFRDADPLGFILFARNCVEPAQIRDLAAELRASVGRAAAPILIDQEGGRVQRLPPPHWPAYPAGARYGEIYDGDPQEGLAPRKHNERRVMSVNIYFMAEALMKRGRKPEALDLLQLADQLHPGKAQVAKMDPLFG